MRATIAGLGLLLAATLAWWFLGSDRRPARVDPERERPPSAAPAPTEALAPAPALERVDTPSPTPPGAPDVAPARGRSAAERVPEPASNRDLVVRVVDPAGAPVVGLTVHLAPEGRTEDDPRLARSTDATGRTRFEGFRERLARDERPWHLWHDVHFRDPLPRLDLTPEVLAADEVVSVQPWSGTIVVEVIEPEGLPAPDGSCVELTLLEPGEEEIRRNGEAVQWSAETTSGEAHFAFVEPRRRWAARAWHLDPDSGAITTGAGPGAGREVRFEVRLGADHPVFLFRAVDEAGRAFANVPLELEDGGLLSTRGRLRTDANGTFRIDGARGGPSRVGWLGTGTYLVRLQREDGERLGRLELPERAEPGLVDAGDVVLAANPLLAAGQVVDESGRPVADAEVAAGAHQLDGNVFLEGPGFSTRSDAAGRFELLGRMPEAEFDLRAAKDRARSQNQRVREGRTDVVLVLRGRHVVSGRVLHDGERPPEGLRGNLRGENGDVRGLESMLGDGAFAFPAVPAGTYDLWFALDDVPVEPPTRVVITQDLWLGEVDLRGRIAELRVYLSAAATGRISWRPSTSEEDWQTRSFQGDRIVLSVPARPIDLCMLPEGHRAAWLEGVRGQCEIVLREPLRVRLTLETTGEIPAAPYVFDPVLERDGMTVSRALGPDSFRDDLRSLLFEVGTPGPLQVTWHLERRGESWAVGGRVLYGRELSIDVLDVPGEQGFTLELDGAALSEVTRAPPF